MKPSTGLGFAAFALMGQRLALPMGLHGRANRPGPASPSAGQPMTPVRGA
jgi:hypothetical protein